MFMDMFTKTMSNYAQRNLYIVHSNDYKTCANIEGAIKFEKERSEKAVQLRGCDVNIIKNIIKNLFETQQYVRGKGENCTKRFRGEAQCSTMRLYKKCICDTLWLCTNKYYNKQQEQTPPPEIGVMPHF